VLHQLCTETQLLMWFRYTKGFLKAVLVHIWFYITSKEQQGEKRVEILIVTHKF